MPLFFFHVGRGADQEFDTRGLDLADAETARAGAVEAVRELRENLSPDEWECWRLEVVDEMGDVVLDLGFAKVPLGALLFLHALDQLSEMFLY